jgi:AbiV family abortive infection protein
MRTRAIRDLAQLSDPDFFAEVSEGIEQVLDNAVRIEQDARFLGEHERRNGYRILLGIAEEEAVKVLILLDAVRCPRDPASQFARQLSRFHDHLAKGIYAEACSWRPATFGELVSYIDRERREFYLDGPNDVDWIFRNRILQNREGAIYVDYVHTDEGHLWLTPSDNYLMFVHTPAALRLVQALNASGCTTPEGLAMIARIWRPVNMTVDYHWTNLRDLNHRTLQELEVQGLLREQSQEVYSTIVNDWPFPIYSADLGLAEVDQDELRELQRRWVPDW